MSQPPIMGPLDEPDPTKYEPREVSADVNGAKDLLAWCRMNGFRFEVLRVGNVAIAGVVDDFPRFEKSKAPPRDDDMKQFEE